MNKEKYIRFSLKMPEDFRDIAVAVLAEMEFEGFEETDEGLNAFIPEPLLNRTELETTLADISGGTVKILETEEIEPRDWNEEWEKSFEAIEIDDWCQVIASFKQPDPRFQHHLVIEPKMSFGTGHHETTRLMIRQAREMDFRGKSVLDMGCGTGILAILAAQLGAAEVLGIDIDVWSSENAVENLELNGISNVEIRQGDASAIPEICYDIILANINRNVLMDDMPAYKSHLQDQGILVLSGFLTSDTQLIEKHYRDAGFLPLRREQEGDWVSQSFILNPGN